MGEHEWRVRGVRRVRADHQPARLELAELHGPEDYLKGRGESSVSQSEEIGRYGMRDVAMAVARPPSHPRLEPRKDDHVGLQVGDG